MKEQRVTFTDGNWVNIQVFKGRYDMQVRIFDKDWVVLCDQNDIALPTLCCLFGVEKKTLQFVVKDINPMTDYNAFVRDIKKKNLMRRLRELEELCNYLRLCKAPYQYRERTKQLGRDILELRKKIRDSF